MNANHRQRKKILRVPLAVILVLALLAPALGAQERRGAQLEVTKIGGAVVKGELLAVEGTDLLIMDGSTPGGVSVSLTDVGRVKVIKRGKVGLIVGGALIGSGCGGAVGYVASTKKTGLVSAIGTVANTFIGGGIGLVAGGLVGVLLSSNKTIAVVSTDPRSVSQAADRLRKLARDRS